MAFLVLTAAVFPSTAIYVAGIVALAAIGLRGWSLLRREQAAQRREAIDLEHRARIGDLEIRERIAQFENQASKQDRHAKKPRSGNPSDRISAASEAGSLFEPVADAVAELQLRVAFLDVGLNDEAALSRYLPVSIYVASDDPGEFYVLRDAIARLLETFDFEIVSETQATRGSIFQSLTAKLRSPAAKAEFKRQAQLAHLALQQQTLGLAQAEINEKQTNAAAEVHKILETQDNYVIAVGSLVGVTHTDDNGLRHSMIVELTPDELIEFQRTGHAMDNAAGAFQTLASLRPEEAPQYQTETTHHLQAGSPPQLPPADE
jgi:hypothetical protein